LINGIILDLDGTVYWGESEVPGAASFVRRFKAHGGRCLFVTNRANRTPRTVCAHLYQYGIICEEKDVLTSAEVTVQHLKQGRVYLIGEEGMRVALEEAGFILTDTQPDYVVISFDRAFNYAKLATACRLIQEGARLVATNPDRYLRTHDGIVPGTGAILAAVVAGSDAKPLVIGKPEPLILLAALQRLDLSKAEVISVGDNLETDVPSGAKAGIRTVLMLTGVSKREQVEKAPVRPTWVVDGYEGLWEIVSRENRW